MQVSIVNVNEDITTRQHVRVRPNKSAREPTECLCTFRTVQIVSYDIELPGPTVRMSRV